MSDENKGRMTQSERTGWFVYYSAPGVTERLKQGPYATLDEAYEHARDIGGYEGITDIHVSSAGAE